MATLRSVVGRETWRGLFAGNGANCIRVLPFSALVCLAYSNLASVSSSSSPMQLLKLVFVLLLLSYSSPQHFPLDKSQNSRWQPVWRMGAGATAGVFATLVTHPMDVVRARLTVQQPSDATAYRGLVNKYMYTPRHTT